MEMAVPSFEEIPAFGGPLSDLVQRLPRTGAAPPPPLVALIWTIAALFGGLGALLQLFAKLFRPS
jgi:hypothetical protein